MFFRRHSTEGAKQSLGQLGERCAAKFLQKKGLRVIAKNWQCRCGEIDLVCQDDGELVFVEVKTRYDKPGVERYLFENITGHKRHKLRLLAELYLLKHCKQQPRPPVRIDAVGVIICPAKKRALSITHYVAAV